MVRVANCHAGVLGSNPGGPKRFSSWYYFTGMDKSWKMAIPASIYSVPLARQIDGPLCVLGIGFFNVWTCSLSFLSTYTLAIRIWSLSEVSEFWNFGKKSKTKQLCKISWWSLGRSTCFCVSVDIKNGRFVMACPHLESTLCRKKVKFKYFELIPGAHFKKYFFKWYDYFKLVHHGEWPT